MSDLDDFLTEFLPRQIAAEEAIHNGDVEPRLALWSRNEPVTLLGAALSNQGWDEVSRTFHQVAAWFSDCTSYQFELVAADVRGDMAYTVGYEHTAASVRGVPTAYTLRVTHIYRREDGDWKIVHRHADRPPVDQTLFPTGQA